MTTVELEGPNPGELNMERDQALLDAAERGEVGCRVYAWEGAWVSLGRFQKPERALLDPDGIHWVLRPTGGKAVLHGHDVTVGLAAPLTALGLGPAECRSVRAVYRRLIVPLVEALRACGVPAALGESTRFVGSSGHTADCFAHVAPNDVVDERTGQKVCGCALRLTASAVLVQASIPARRPLVEPARVFAQAHAASWSHVEPAAYAEALSQALLTGWCYAERAPERTIHI